MSTRSEIRPYQVIPNPQASPANSGSMAGNITSAPTIIQKISMLSYSYSWTGTSPVGAVSVQVSDDYSIDSQGRTLNAGTWNTLTFLSAGLLVTSVAVTGNSGNGYIDIFQTGAYAIRTVYTFTSGVGTLQCTVNGKVS